MFFSQIASLLMFPLAAQTGVSITPVSDANVILSSYNWYREGSSFAQSANPGAYLKLGFTGTSMAVRFDVSPLTNAKVPAGHYPIARYSVDGGPATTLQLAASTTELKCAAGLKAGNHTLLLQYVSGYVFLDFWSPVNILRVTGSLVGNSGAKTVAPSGAASTSPRNALFLGDSITNGDDDVATFKNGITNEVDTQDATLGYPAIVAGATDSEYGVVAYGGASWEGQAADGHTPGLMSFAPMLDSAHSRLMNGKFSPTPDDIYINMGENAPPRRNDVLRLLSSVRAASRPETNIFLIVPFSGRSRPQLTAGYSSYRNAYKTDSHAYLIDLGNNPYLTDAGPTMLSVDGQHPLAAVHAKLAALIVAARDRLLSVMPSR